MYVWTDVHARARLLSEGRNTALAGYLARVIVILGEVLRVYDETADVNGTNAFYGFEYLIGCQKLFVRFNQLLNLVVHLLDLLFIMLNRFLIFTNDKSCGARLFKVLLLNFPTKCIGHLFLNQPLAKLEEFAQIG